MNKEAAISLDDSIASILPLSGGREERKEDSSFQHQEMLPRPYESSRMMASYRLISKTHPASLYLF